MQHNKAYTPLVSWLTQLQAGKVDPQLTQTIATQLATHRPAGVEPLLLALADATEEATVDGWLQEWLADTIPPAPASPTFDLSFLGASLSSPGATLPKLGATVAAMLQIADEQLQTLTIWFRQIPELLTRPPSLAWATRSASQPLSGLQVEGNKLFQYTLPEGESIWGGELSAFAENEQTCRVEIAIFRLDTLSADLANIPIALHDGDRTHMLYTDAGGVVEFIAIPQSRLAEIVVQINAGH